jgi:hypothetical protein
MAIVIAISPQTTAVAPVVDKVATSTASVTSQIETAFSGYGQLRRICSCESHLTQFEKDGVTVLHGRENPKDLGICQINELYHGEQAKKLGFDLYSLIGNVAYAKHLYESEGTKPWVWSESCWKTATSTS